MAKDAEKPKDKPKDKPKKKRSIIPKHLEYPHTFTSRQTYEMDEGKEWHVVGTESDLDLNGQLRQFVDRTLSAVTQISAPMVNIFSESDNRRVYITSVSLLYIPATEGSHDRKRNVDADPTDPEVTLGDIHREPDDSSPADAEPGDGGSG